MELPQIDNYQQLFLSDTPLLDVRAPVEFLQGAFPRAENLPLINDEERHAIGIRYKELGQDKAIELGYELVQGEVKQSRVAGWADFAQQHPRGALYCFRGGMRSKISQQWLYEKTGVMYPRVKGGYKAMRRYLLDELDAAAAQMQFIILSGRTGTGKTILLNCIQHKVDLEGIYHHRGSAFGKHVQPQPSQIDVENALAITFLKHRANHVSKLVLEDESRNIGSRRLPDTLKQSMKLSPLILLEASVEERIRIVFDEYILASLAEYRALLGEDKGFYSWAENLQNALDKIQRRLGGQRHQEIKSIMADAINQHRDTGDPQHHKDWIRALLVDYYDPMYDYQLARKTDRVIFRGERESVLGYLLEHQGIK